MSATSATMTFLFTDLVSSTSMATRIGDNAYDDVRRQHFGQLRSAISSVNGEEVKTIGDSVMAAFTSTVAALDCAVRMQQAVARSGSGLGMRVGISVGEASREEDDWFGTPVVEANRLCGVASAGEIVVADVARLLAGSRTPYSFSPLGEIDLKGLPVPLAASRLEWTLHEASLHPLPPAIRVRDHAVPFQGRYEQRTAIATAVHAAAASGPVAVAIAGEPGIGKTRLAAEVALEAHASGAVVLFGRCDEQAPAPYQPFVQALSGWASALPDPDLERLPQTALAEVSRLLPLLRDRVPGLAPPTVADAATERSILFNAVASLLHAAAADAPLLLVLDDLHWADTASLRLLRHLLHDDGLARLALVMTYRDTELGRTHPLSDTLAAFRREGVLQRWTLGGLTADDVRAIVGARAGDVPDRVAALVHAETEGNPFFVEEVIAHLMEMGTLDADAVVSAGIPEGVRDVVGRRLSHLTPAANDALGVAAVIGSRFSAREVAEALGAEVPDVLDAFEDAIDARLLVASGGGFEFAHALVRQTLYQELPTSRRVRLHWRVGEVLERRRAGDDHLGEVARHLAEGVLVGDPAKAVDALVRAGEHALEVLAFEEAQSFADAALAVIAEDRGDWRLEYRALILRGDAAMGAGEPPRAWDSYRAGLEIASANGDTEALAIAAMAYSWVFRIGTADTTAEDVLTDALARIGAEQVELRAPILGNLAVHISVSRGRAAVRPLLDELEQLASGGNPVAVEAYVTALGNSLLGTPQPDLLAEIGQRAVGLRTASVERARALASRVVWRRYGVHGLALIAEAVRGNRPGVDRWLAESQEFVDGAHFLPRFTAAMWEATLALAEGRFTDAKAIASDNRRASARASAGFELASGGQIIAARFEEGRTDRIVVDLADVPHDVPTVRTWRALHALALAEEGRVDESLLDLHAFFNGDEVLIPDDWTGPLALRCLCEVTAHAGDRRLAGRLIDLVVPYEGQLLVNANFVTLESAADRAIGQLLTVLGRYDEAADRFTAALSLEEGFGAHALAARTRWWLAWSRRRAGDERAARDHAAATARRATALGMANIARFCRELLNEVARSGQPTTEPA